MVKNKLRFVILGLMLIFGSSLSTQVHSISTNQDNEKLRIYTYDSLFADPEFDYVSAFETFANLSSGSLEVTELADAGTVLTKSVAEKGIPIADVLIGLDNALIHKAREENILTPYQPANSSSLKPSLISGLASDYLLTPYDYGVISLWYQNNLLPEIDQDNFVLQDLITDNLAKSTIVQNPTISTPGLGFLLSTIAIYGDPSNIDGLLTSNWENFWKSSADDLRIVGSWGDAIALMFTPEENRPMMVSYTSSPAYGACLFNDTTTSALLSNENGKLRGWQQIEGIGLVNGGPNPELAKMFIDWFISYEVQKEVLQSQWMFPAINGITPPPCYDSAIHPDNVEPLNSIIPQSDLEKYLDNWLDDWEIVIVDAGDSNFLDFNLNPIFTFSMVIAIYKINRYKRSRRS